MHKSIVVEFVVKVFAYSANQNISVNGVYRSVHSVCRLLWCQPRVYIVGRHFRYLYEERVQFGRVEGAVANLMEMASAFARHEVLILGYRDIIGVDHFNTQFRRVLRELEVMQRQLLMLFLSTDQLSEEWITRRQSIPDWDSERLRCADESLRPMSS